jgi:hypothetical protein
LLGLPLHRTSMLSVGRALMFANYEKLRRLSAGLKHVADIDWDDGLATQSGSGAPQGSLTISGPGGTPSYSESGAVVYDRTSIAVSGSTSTYDLIHRVTSTITAPGSAQVWTAYLSLTGASSYTLTIEVSYGVRSEIEGVPALCEAHASSTRRSPSS